MQDDEAAPRRKRSWPQRSILAVGLALILVCMLGASVAGYTLVKYATIDRVDDLGTDQVAKGDPKNILIVAVDTREGHSGVNTDTIMVVRVDPKSDRLAVTSFPRDLIVTVADTGDSGMINAVYNREGDAGPGNLIATLRQNFDIPIHHFVEVNFESFKQVVDSVGGVPIWMERAAHDPHSGFYSEVHGCVTLDGESSLQFVRSRYLDVMIDGEWEDDPKSDEHRVLRQQVFVQRTLALVLAEVKSNPLRLQELVDIGVNNVRLDENLGFREILGLGEQFKGFDAGKLETYGLPVAPHPDDDDRLQMLEAEAEPMLNVFRGLAPGEIRPGLVNVTVLNGTIATDDPAQVRDTLAGDVSGALQQVGFKMGSPDDADEFQAQTSIRYAPGQLNYAQRLAQHITSEVAIPLVEDAALAPGDVTLIAGADFETVHEIATPLDQLPVAPGADAPVETTEPQAEAPATPAAPAPPAETTETTENPFIIGSAPENANC